MSILEERALRKREQGFAEPFIAARPQVEIDPNELHRIVREKVIASGDISVIYTEEGKEDLKKRVFELVGEKYSGLTRLERAQIAQEVVMDITGYGPIQPLIEDKEVSDILVNRFDRVYYEKGGKMMRSSIQFRDEQHLRDLIEKIVANVGRRIDESQPLVDARLPDGSRINAAIRPVSVDGPALSIRRFNHSITAEEMIAQGAMTREQYELFGKFVRARLNMIISGGTGTGKTTFLNILSQLIPEHERVVTIEEVTELKLKVPNLIRLETRGVNIEGRGKIDASQLVVNALRMRPDRIIVGECRRGEAFDMLQAMNTGHEGSLTTLHANSPQDALFRLENMVMMAGYNLPVQVIREHIASAIHVVFQLTRLSNGLRVVKQVAEVMKDGDSLVTVDLFVREGIRLVAKNEPSLRLRRLMEVER